jgi:hypothetical protein
MLPVPVPPAHPRAYAAAFLTATLAALVVDAVLQLALDAVAVAAYGGGAPWWVTTHLVERGRWVALAALLCWLAPSLFPREDMPQDARAPLGAAGAWRQTGMAVVVVPLLWVLATWIVSALRFTLLGSWATEGLVFLSSGYYRSLFVDYAPWLMAGLTVLAIRRHLD